MYKNIVLLLLGCLIGSAFSTCYISPDGSDDNDCSLASKCKTINQCLTNFINDTQLIISLDAGTYTDNCDVSVSYPSPFTSLKIHGPSGNSPSFDCTGQDVRHFTFENVAGLSVEINDINFFSGSTIENGGCIYASNISSLVVQDADFLDCYAGGYGGAIYSDSSSTLVLDSIFQNNTAQIGGGALYLKALVNGSSIDKSHFGANRAQVGGGLYFVGDYLSLTQSNITENVATTFGGGLYLVSVTPSTQGAFDFLGSIFSLNVAGLEGGALYASNLNYEWDIYGALFESSSVQSHLNFTDSNIACGNVTSLFCYACTAKDCTAECLPSGFQSCSTNSSVALCYGSTKFDTCSDPSCVCAKEGLSKAAKILIIVICLCLLVGIILILADVIKYFIRKRKTTSYSPI